MSWTPINDVASAVRRDRNRFLFFVGLIDKWPMKQQPAEDVERLRKRCDTQSQPIATLLPGWW